MSHRTLSRSVLGVEVVEPGLIGVTITGTDYEHAYGGNKSSNPITGTLSHVGISTATNWDPFASRELGIKLHCTTDPLEGLTERPPSPTGDRSTAAPGGPLDPPSNHQATNKEIHMNSIKRPSTGRSIGMTSKIVLATAFAAAAVAGVGVTAASASPFGNESSTVEAFRETIKPWDSITIPSLSCPNGYLENTVYSSGRILPKGVEIVDGSAIGTTITDVKSTGVTDYWNRTYHPATGTDSSQGWSTATNWDPFASHELVIKLHCTTDLSKAYMDPTYG